MVRPRGFDMLITVQFPFCDLRRFCPDAQETLVEKPWWPDPRYPQFVRFFGVAVDRPKGGLEGFAENSHCRIHRGLRLRQRAVRIGSVSSRVRIRDTRLFTDGTALLKFEIALAIGLSKKELFPEELQSLLQNVLSQEVSVRRVNGSKARAVELGHAPSLLRNLYVKATTLTGKTTYDDLVFPLRPAIHILSNPEEEIITPKKSRAVKSVPNVALYFFKFHGSDKRRFTSAWLQIPNRASEKTQSRRLRIALLRLAAEYGTFRTVAEGIYSGKIDPSPKSRESQLLQDYLRRSIDVFLRDEKFLSEDAVRLARENLSLVHPGMVDSVLHKLKFGSKIRGNLHKNLCRHIEAVSKEREKEHRETQSGPISVENVRGNVIINSTAGKSINATVDRLPDEIDVELARLLKQLSVGISKAAELMDDGDAISLARRLESFSSECSHETPNRSILDPIGDAIVDATSAVHSHSGSINRTIKAIMNFFG